jgi:amidohydrolase
VAAVDEVYAEAKAWRRQLHAMPETGFEEHRTSAFVAEKLAAFGLETHRRVGGTGVVAVLRGRPADRAVAFRADLDALNILEANTFEHRSTTPGKMHACGHDGHTAMLLGAAKILADSPDGLAGSLYFIFQPAEEHGRGALAMLDDGLLTRFPVQEVYGVHNAPWLPVGTFGTRIGGLMASEDNFEIVVRGVGGHASRPHRGVDPLVIGAQVVTALQTVVARNIDPLASAVVSVTEFITDGTRNVIPSTVTIRGDTRSFSPGVQATIEAAMRRVTAGVCAAGGAACDFAYTHEFRPVVTTPVATRAALRAAETVFDSVLDDCEPVTASEDFAHMLAACGEGNFGFVGAGPSSGDGVNLHNPQYDFNDEALPYGIGYWTTLARQRLAGDA